MRLTTTLKQTITKYIINITFKKTDEEIATDSLQLVRDYLRTDLGDKFDAFAALPPNWFGTCDTFKFQHQGSNYGIAQLNLTESVAVPDYMRISSPYSSQKVLPIDQYTQLADRLGAIMDQKQQVAADKKTLRINTDAILNRCATSNALLEAWPNIGDYIPLEWLSETPKATLPATIVNAANDLINKYPPTPKKPVDTPV
jgi:hypothetical protein